MAPATSTASLLIGAYDAAVAACDPQAAVAGAIDVDGQGITIGGERFEGATPDDVVVVAIGKAAAAMARGVVSVLGPVRGLAVSNHAEDCPVNLMVGAHPVPDTTSLACGEALLSFVGSLDTADVAVYLISGGGSAVAVAPADGVSIADIEALNRVLMAAGIPIGEMNEVRASVSRIKGGGLARASGAGRSVTLVLSDVVGAGVSHVASGPTLGAGMGAAAGRVIEAHAIADRLPASIEEAVGRFRPTAGSNEPFFVVGSTEVAAGAAAGYVESCGVPARIETTQLQGEARDEAAALIGHAVEGAVTVATGETTVTVTGDGVGGRNQEAAVAAALSIAGSGVTFLACGTDGIDGPTPAAGAVVDGTTAARARGLGVDLEGHLERNDSYPALETIGALVIRGDTGTNVADLWLVAKGIEPGPCPD